MPQEFYSENEAEAILRLATKQSITGGLSRDELLRTAAEVGLTESQLAAAEAQFRASNDEAQLAERFKQRQRAKFIQEAAGSGGFYIFLIGVWWLSGGGSFWPGWLLIFFAWGAFDEIPKRLVPASAPYQKAFAKWKAKGAPDLADDPEEEAVSQGNKGQVVVGIHAGRHRRRARRDD